MVRAGDRALIVALALAESHHEALRAHLFPGDGLEAAALILCNRAACSDRHRLVAHEVVPIPHDACTRARDRVTWPSDILEDCLEKAERLRMSVVKVHSHPQGYPKFSPIDDEGDAEVLPVMRSWVEADVPHASAVMLPDGRMFGRYLWRGRDLTPLDLIAVAGPDLKFWWHGDDEGASETGASQDQAFGDGTTRRMSRLRIGVVGWSGTGSPTTEQFVRLGAGEVITIEDDRVKLRNLNRILHSTVKDAEDDRLKVEVAEEAVLRTGLPTRIIPIPKSIMTPEAVRALANCDVIFGCVDTHTARFVMNLISTHYLIPYFDIGVMLDAERDADGKGRIKDILGTVHYLVPGRSSLISRDAISLDMVASEGLHQRDPAAAAQQVAEKYIRGVAVNRPAVISINMFASSLAVNDFLARLHPYRRSPNRDVASIEFSLGQLRLTPDEETEDCPVLGPSLGLGDRDPLLGLAELRERP
jgi:hypothetical protein